ncbi:hypothetical protein CDAR_206171 [Caerostris darwini]|uniref:Uncharacterized protein n=1 Tax=Caerostris darwini TaxID=1538125 RepID=A0AAV4RJW7_9ARAC|nr:hypothetical protein CDAR_206171 [Caerostris darwini]
MIKPKDVDCECVGGFNQCLPSVRCPCNAHIRVFCLPWSCEWIFSRSRLLFGGHLPQRVPPKIVWLNETFATTVCNSNSFIHSE